METLKKHLPYSGPEGINELRRIAARFEEKIFSGAVNQVINRLLNLFFGCFVSVWYNIDVCASLTRETKSMYF